MGLWILTVNIMFELVLSSATSSEHMTANIICFYLFVQFVVFARV